LQTETGIPELAEQLVKKYESRPAVLDGLLQLADNPTSMSAGYGIEENLPLIKSNLSARYGSSENIEEIFQTLVREKNRIMTEARTEIYSAEAALRDALQNSPVLEDHFINRVKSLSVIEKQVVSGLSQLDLEKTFTVMTASPIAQSWGGKMLIAYVLALGMDIPAHEIEPILIKSGFANRLKWISSGGGHNITQPLVIPYYVKRKKAELASLSSPVSKDLTEILNNLVSKNGYSELAALDEVSELGGIVQQRPDLEGLPAWKGIIGKYEGSVAISPLLQGRLKNELDRIKSELTTKFRNKLASVMAVLKDKHWPQMEFTHVQNGEDYWRIEAGLGRPVINVVCSPWLTPNIMRLSGGSTIQLVAILTNQSFPRAESMIYRMRQSSGTTIAGASIEKVDYKKLSNDVDSFVDEIFATLKQLLALKPEASSTQPLPRPEASEKAPKKLPPKEPMTEFQMHVPPGDIMLGSSTLSTKQWGVLGKTSEGKNVNFDLNAPHILFVCGKMGSGKGYTIGVLSEMLCRESVPNISSVERPATIVVLYKPKEDKRSEFWSIRYPNDVPSEVESLRDVYGVVPSKLLDDSKFKVFLDPGVYQKAADLFKGDYGTQNVYPLYVDPSDLTGEEWAIVLSAGGKTDQLYVKQLFQIIEDRQFQPFDINTIKSDVLNNEMLTQAQQRLALTRLKILQNYLQIGKGEQDFVSNLAIGGVNIIDFRKTIRTPDDVFSVMTLILSRLQTKKGLENEPFVFVINEAHDYFKGDVSKDFVESIEYLIRRKRHGANWLMLDTHFPDDVDEKVIKLADVKMVNFLDVTVNSRILNDAFKGRSDEFSKLKVGETLICADDSSLGKNVPLKVQVRPRLTKHGAPTKTAIS